jgi:hypothetical protein
VSTQIVTFPNGQTILLPPATVAAIAQSSAAYRAPLWSLRAERVLKLGAHQWIEPVEPTAVARAFAQQPQGLVCTAWKLFTRDWQAAATAYTHDRTTYPDHPRHLGPEIIPLVDEDQAAQIGWVCIDQLTPINAQYAIFLQFTLLDHFAPRPLPAVYG